MQDSRDQKTENRDFTSVSTYGAVDLGAGDHSVPAPNQNTSASKVPSGSSASAASNGEMSINVPLVVQATEQELEGLISNSRTVPVIVVLWSATSLDSKQFLTLFTEIIQQHQGQFQLASIDIDAVPNAAEIFKAQAVPTTIALIGGRPLPLFQGVAAKEQIIPLLGQVHDAARQMGVTGRVHIEEKNAADSTPTEPAGYEAARKAVEQGKLADALAQWERLIERYPRDEVPKSEAAAVRLLIRERDSRSSDTLAQADTIFSAGNYAAAFDILLSRLEATRDTDERETIRLRILDLFRIAGPADPAVRSARTRLSALLMV